MGMPSDSPYVQTSVRFIFCHISLLRVGAVLQSVADAHYLQQYSIGPSNANWANLDPGGVGK